MRILEKRIKNSRLRMAIFFHLAMSGKCAILLLTYVKNIKERFIWRDQQRKDAFVADQSIAVFLPVRMNRTRSVLS